MFGVPWDGYGIACADGRPSGRAVAGLERLNRALQNIKDLYIGVAVKRHGGSRWYRDSNQADVVLNLVGRNKELKKGSIGGNSLLMMVTFVRVFG
jgi:hypothetical protein